MDKKPTISYPMLCVFYDNLPHISLDNIKSSPQRLSHILHSNRVPQDALIVWFIAIFLARNYFRDKKPVYVPSFLPAAADILGYTLNKMDKFTKFYG